MLVNAGLTPYEALRAATADAGGVPGRSARRPDRRRARTRISSLLDADPLVDIHAVDKIAGVMVRGAWLAPKDLKAMHDGLVAAYKSPAWEAPIQLGAEGFAARVTQYVVSDNGAPVGAYAIAQRGTTIVEREALEDELSSTKTTLGEHHAQTARDRCRAPRGRDPRDVHAQGPRARRLAVAGDRDATRRAAGLEARDWRQGHVLDRYADQRRAGDARAWHDHDSERMPGTR